MYTYNARYDFGREFFFSSLEFERKAALEGRENPSKLSSLEWKQPPFGARDANIVVVLFERPRGETRRPDGDTTV